MREKLFQYWNSLKKRLHKIGIARIPGTLAASRILYRILAPRGLTAVKAHNLTFWIDPKDKTGIAPALLENGDYEPFITQLFMQILKPGMTFIDVGANIGYFSVIASGLVGKSGKVFSFEPEPRNYALLAKNILANKLDNCIAVNKALSDKKGRITLYLDEKNWGGHSLSKENVKGKVAINVETIPLDDFLNEAGSLHVDVIKIDTQGAEGLILKGMKETISHNRKLKIIMEFWPYALRNMGTDPKYVLELLKQNGFAIKQLDEEKGKIVPVDEFSSLINYKKNWATNLLLEKN